MHELRPHIRSARTRLITHRGATTGRTHNTFRRSRIDDDQRPLAVTASRLSYTVVQRGRELCAPIAYAHAGHTLSAAAAKLRNCARQQQLAPINLNYSPTTSTPKPRVLCVVRTRQHPSHVARAQVVSQSGRRTRLANTSRESKISHKFRRSTDRRRSKIFNKRAVANRYAKLSCCSVILL